MSWQDGTLLGRQVAAPLHHQPSILTGITRELGRAALGALPCAGVMQGFDDWHVFELSWLDDSGRRQVALGRLRFDAASPRLIESKSLKLYFNSLNFLRLPSVAALKALVEQDLTPVSGAPVVLTVLPLDGLVATVWAGEVIDHLPWPPQVDATAATAVHPAVLAHAADGAQPRSNHVEHTLISHGFRSNCPVTGQPDWASVRIRYRGRPWDHGTVLAYLHSYAQHCGFHEQCVEQVFFDLWTRLQPIDLMVQAAYTRRGGLDINPVRSSRTDWWPKPARLHRQ